MAYGSYTVSRHPCSSGEHPDGSARQTRADPNILSARKVLDRRTASKGVHAPLLNAVNWQVSRSVPTSFFWSGFVAPPGATSRSFCLSALVAGADAGNDPAFKPADGRPPSRWWRASVHRPRWKLGVCHHVARVRVTHEVPASRRVARGARRAARRPPYGAA